MNENTEDDDKHQATQPAAAEDWEDCLTFTAKSSRKYFKLIVHRIPPKKTVQTLQTFQPPPKTQTHTHMNTMINRIATLF